MIILKELHEASYYATKEDNKVQCLLCPRNCIIHPDKLGQCSSRKNINGKLYALGYNRFTSVHDDPIEKKPLYHFKPGTHTMSFGGAGCNLMCDFCQNWQISQLSAESNNMINITSEHAINRTKEHNCETIAYTYNEPLINFEWIKDTGKKAHENGISNILVSNGLINEEPLEELIPVIDAANIDIKSFDSDFYNKICHFPGLENIKKTAIRMWDQGIHVELTMLLIPGYNDKPEDIKLFSEWVMKLMDDKVPIHFSRFYPHYKMRDVPATPVETVINASKIAEEMGLKYVYTGNLPYSEINTTHCQSCEEILVERVNYNVKIKNLSKEGTCRKCNAKSDIVV